MENMMNVYLYIIEVKQVPMRAYSIWVQVIIECSGQKLIILNRFFLNRLISSYFQKNRILQI